MSSFVILLIKSSEIIYQIKKRMKKKIVLTNGSTVAKKKNGKHSIEESQDIVKRNMTFWVNGSGMGLSLLLLDWTRTIITNIVVTYGER